MTDHTLLDQFDWELLESGSLPAKSKNGNTAGTHLAASTVLGRLQAKFLNLQTPVGMRLHSSFSHSEARRRIRYRQLPNQTQGGGKALRDVPPNIFR